MILDRPVRVDFSIGERPSHVNDTNYSRGHPPLGRNLTYSHPYQPNRHISRLLRFKILNLSFDLKK